MKNWRSYRYKTSQENKNSSIANDEVALLATRLEFFIPKLMEIMRPWQWLTYIFFWSLFLTVIERHGLSGWSDFIIKFFSRVIQNALTVIPALYLVDYLRPVFKNASIPSVSLRIVMLMMFSATVSMVLVVLVMINLGWMEYNRQAFVINLLFNTVLTGGFTAVFLLYFLRSYRELNALKLSFEYKLTAQNDLIKARTAPHFFFNTINTLVSLIESNPPKAADLLQHVSALFRASFSGTREISFEEEVDLCEHYLAIESSRLADKLEVNWTLPEEDIMYDMVITALTLQSVLEKILLNVVEMTTETICINIEVTWEQHRVKIMIDVALPKKTLIINHDLRQHMNFYIQADRLRAHFGQSADIQSSVASTQIITIIDYPLQDVGL
ncbi:histidine kinase [Psychrobacter sp. 4Dc]|nr:histidine kinase [Psychrobacter sp. Urea-trap-18]MBA6286489.1 histidine kinase [Psychrobacter sp. Urea-trap-16]MBA6318500.1 histidine kinase [Psychrobacter sp. Urea-trap-20]MBA6334721.1 histidine kinase [Psychrobacter sp. Urea-trap-19]PKG61359.1 histidine kinase [Psychrobacter sp. Choline-3u-12]PKH67493.1 histidine kinase [Psychrobacter sp. 4Dc]PKH81055.1 histidine kinase [Psychrobacter sp. 4Bb]